MRVCVLKDIQFLAVGTTFQNCLKPVPYKTNSCISRFAVFVLCKEKRFCVTYKQTVDISSYVIFSVVCFAKQYMVLIFLKTLKMIALFRDIF